MKMFSLCPRDQMRQSWVLCVEGKARERNKTAKDTFRNVHALLGSAVTGEIRMKPQYNSIRCGLCRRYDSARAFEVGFDDTATIRIKGDFGYTTDRIFVISDKLLSTLKTHQVGGFESKPVGKTGWHAFQANRFVESNDSVIQTAGALCPECGRPEDSWGSYQRLSDLVPPE